MLFGASLLLLALSLARLHRCCPFSPISPSWFFLSLQLVVMVFGAVLVTSSTVVVVVEAYPNADASLTILSSLFFGLACFALGVSSVAKRFSGTAIARRFHLVIRFSPVQARVGIAIALLAILSLIGGTGVSNILYRQQYMVNEIASLHILGSALALVAPLLLGIISFSPLGELRTFAKHLAAVLMLILASLSTRSLGLVPIVFALGGLLAAPSKRSPRFALVIAVLIAPILVALMLVERGRTEQGLETLPSLLTSAWDGAGSGVLSEVSGNLFMAFPITYLSAHLDEGNDLSYIAMSISPLPGEFHNWHDRQVRLNAFVPTNLMGDLIRFGALPLGFVCLSVGAVFGVVEKRLRDPTKNRPLVLTMMGLGLLFSVVSLQYASRAALRYVYYILAIEALARFVDARSRARAEVHLAN